MCVSPPRAPWSARLLSALLVAGLAASGLALWSAPTPDVIRLNDDLAFLYVGDVDRDEIGLSPDSQWAVYVKGKELFAARLDGSVLPVKLNPPLEGGLVSEFSISPDSALVAFLAQIGGVIELHVAPIDGSLPASKLNAPLVTGGRVLGAEFSPNSVRVVYSARQDDSQVTEVYGVPSDGSSTALKLNGTLAAGSQVDSVRVTPDGSRVLYRATQGQSSETGLFSAPIDGSEAAIALNGPLFPNGEVRSDFTTRGPMVLYAGQQDSLVHELYSVPADGSASPTKLNDPLPIGGGIVSFSIAPDLLNAVFVASQDTLDEFELYRVPLDGSLPPAKLNPPLVPGDDVFTFECDPGALNVVYRVGTSCCGIDLFVVPLLGGTSIQLNSTVVPGADVGSMSIDPLGARVIYVGDQDTSDVIEIYSAPIDGSQAAVKLNGALVAGGNVTAGFHLDASGNHVVFLADQSVDEEQELFSAPLDGSLAATRLNLPFPAGSAARIEELRLAADSSTVVYVAEQELPLRELFAVAIDGVTAPSRIDGPRIPQTVGDVLYDFALAPGGGSLVYRADQGPNNLYELYRVPLDGSLQPVRVNDPLSPGGGTGGNTNPTGNTDKGSPAITPDGTRVAYLAWDVSGPSELFSAPLDGSAAPIRLSQTPVPGGAVTIFSISPDGSRVVFFGNLEDAADLELFSVPIDGSEAPTRLNTQFRTVIALNAGSVFQMAGNSGRFLFLQDNGLRNELFSVPIDGSSAPLKLSGTLVSGGNVVAYLTGPAGERVVYIADQDTDQLFELYAVPADGSTPAVKLSVAPSSVLPTNGSVRFNADGTRVAFLANLNLVTELFGVPSDGASAAIRLNPVLSGNRDVFDFSLSQDADIAVYRADQDQDTVNELYSVPLDGSAAATKLNGPLVSGGDVFQLYRIAPLVGRVVYRADQDINGVHELYSAPLDGSLSPVRLHDPFPTFADVNIGTIRLSPNGRRVLYLADALEDKKVELFSAPVDGSAQGHRVNPPLGGNVKQARVAPDLSRIVYLADAEGTGTDELFSAPFGPRAQSLAPSRGTIRGGTAVVLTGVGFTPSTEVWFGPRAAAVTFVSATELHVVTPSGGPVPPPTPGAVGGKSVAFRAHTTVDVTTSEGQAANTCVAAFRYVPFR